MDNITSFLVVALVVLVLKFRASFRIARSGKHWLHLLQNFKVLFSRCMMESVNDQYDIVSTLE
jgi:hypothetical protein